MPQVVLRLLRQRGVLQPMQLQQLPQQPGERRAEAEGYQSVLGQESKCIQVKTLVVATCLVLFFLNLFYI